jgi:hypothetical protein
MTTLFGSPTWGRRLQTKLRCRDSRRTPADRLLRHPVQRHEDGHTGAQPGGRYLLNLAAGRSTADHESVTMASPYITETVDASFILIITYVNFLIERRHRLRMVKCPRMLEGPLSVRVVVLFLPKNIGRNAARCVRVPLEKLVVRHHRHHLGGNSAARMMCPRILLRNPCCPVHPTVKPGRIELFRPGLPLSQVLVHQTA